MKSMKYGAVPGGELRLSTTANLVLFPGFLMTLCILPAILHSQWITGPAVNTVLLLAAVLMGPLQAAALGTLPGVVALAAGLLPMPLAPMLPFIIAGNWALAYTVHYMKGRGLVSAMALAAAVKCAVIYGAYLLAFEPRSGRFLPDAVAVMMGWPQLVTALAGGAIALGILALVKRPIQKG